MTEAEFAHAAIIFLGFLFMGTVIAISAIPGVDLWLENRKKKRAA